MLKQVTSLVALSVFLTVGCAVREEGAPSAAAAEIQSFEHHSLANVTAAGLANGYARTISLEVASARARNPDVRDVSVAGIGRFTGGASLLGGSLVWYFDTTGTSSIAVDQIEQLLADAVRPGIDASVEDGFVVGSKLKDKVPNVMFAALADAQVDAALTTAKTPAGVNMRATFDRARAEWFDEGVFLPVIVSSKPTPEQIKELFRLEDVAADELSLEATGTAALDAINDLLDPVILADLVNHAPGIKDAWLLHGTDGDSESTYVFVLDEHSQLWGFGTSFQVD